jgi:hypothetical protein
MFNRDHDFTIFNSSKFLKLLEFKTLTILIFNIEFLKNPCILIFESQSNLTWEFIW